MANELGQPTAQEIAEKFCTEMLCNALLCDGCPVQAIQRAAQHSVQADMSCACPLDEFGMYQMPALPDGTCPTCRKPYR